jgi:hypothetical protein
VGCYSVLKRLEVEPFHCSVKGTGNGCTAVHLFVVAAEVIVAVVVFVVLVLVDGICGCCCSVSGGG